MEYFITIEVLGEEVKLKVTATTKYSPPVYGLPEDSCPESFDCEILDVEVVEYAGDLLDIEDYLGDFEYEIRDEIYKQFMKA